MDLKIAAEVMVCLPPKVQVGITCVDPLINLVTPVSGTVGQTVEITVTGNPLPLTMVLDIDRQSQPCSIIERTSTTAVFNCPLDVVGTWDLLIQSNSTLSGGVPILTSFTHFTVNSADKPTGKLNDTGITICGNDGTNNSVCPVAGYPGQDAEYGRDAQALAGTLQKVGGGHAGFDFTKLDSEGNPLALSNDT